jgi:hypothetical protein
MEKKWLLTGGYRTNLHRLIDITVLERVEKTSEDRMALTKD